MRPSTLTKWCAAALLFCAAAQAGACGSEGGAPPGTGGSPPVLVVCDNLGFSIPRDGDLCNQLGYICDIPCGNCYYTCEEDLIWHEHCWECPGNRPAEGDACDPCVDIGYCSYPPETTCGPGSSTALSCDEETATWTEGGVEPCP